MKMDYLIYQLKYDTVHGKFPIKIQKISNTELEVNGQRIRLTNCRDPSKINWGDADFAMAYNLAGQSEYDPHGYRAAFCQLVLKASEIK